MENKIYHFKKGEYKIGGYAGKMVDYTINAQLTDRETWKLFVEQFRSHTDVVNNWRGEFWGKMMRGGCLTYFATKNEELYKVLTESVKDLLTTQEKSGRISSRKISDEFTHWDMWCRKYVLLGCEYYLEICKSEALRKKIIRAMKRHADYILKKVGQGRGKIGILDTSPYWGSLNSCSILEPFVKLYGLTGEKRYFDFATYILSTGCCKDFDLIESSLKKDFYPYQFPYTKAYEMMSCLEGALEYYKYTGEERLLKAVETFIAKVVETDYTIIGCSGCMHELFDNSSVTQTEPTDVRAGNNGIAQETCVTVTFMKLCAKTYAVTGKGIYIDYIEKSGYNAMFGAVNNENQTMKDSVGMAWDENGVYYPEHEPFPFDSYSPLYYDKRGKRIGGFQDLYNGRSYGCCACIGSAGTAVFALCGIVKDNDGYYVNLYNDGKLTDGDVKIAVRGDVYKKTSLKVVVKGKGKKFALRIRKPAWAEKFEVRLNCELLSGEAKNGYIEINRVWNDDVISVKYSAPVKMCALNGKVAFTKGPVVLARDRRFEDIKKPVAISLKDGKTVRAKIVKNDIFYSNLAVKVYTKNGDITLCDYSEAGKDYDDKESLITVWQDVERA